MLAELPEAEFDAYVERMVRHFADELVAAREFEPDEARAKSRRALETHLPQGRATPGHHFRVILDDGERAGVVWFAEQLGETPPRVYLFDIAVDEARRGRGLGTAVLHALEREARALGAHELVLSVFHHNAGAVRLYERLGFEPRERDAYGMRMALRLT